MLFISLLFFLLHPFLSIGPIIKLWGKDDHSALKASIILALIMGFLSYYSRSKYYGDIERYVELLTYYKNVPFSGCFNLFYKGLYAQDIFFWLCSRLPDPWLMVFFVGFILYFISFYIIIDYSSIVGIEKKDLVFLLFILLCILPFYNFICATRSSLALSYVYLGIYLRTHKKGRLVPVIILFALGCFTHEAAIATVFVFLVSSLIKKHYWLVGIVIALIVALFGSGLLTIVVSNNTILYNVINKGIGYAEGGSAANTVWARAVSGSIVARATRIYFFILLVLFLVGFFHGIQYKEAFYTFNVPVSIGFMILGMMAFPTTVYLRYIMPFIPLGIVSYVEKKRISKQVITKKGKYILLFLAIIGMLFQIYTTNTSLDYSYLEKILYGLWGML